MIGEIECVVPAGDICGEGAVWDSENNALYWADINRFLLHRYSTETHSTESWHFNEPVVSVNLTTTPGVLLLVLAGRIGFWSVSTHPKFATIHSLPTAPAMRFNDAKVDPRGSLWVGTMRDNVGPDGDNIEVPFTDGVLYRVDPDGSVTEWMNGIGISNTLAWSPDRSTFYFGDSTANAIYAFDFDRSTGGLSARRMLLSGSEQGLPDGSAMDAEGYLWNARYGAGCLIRIGPSGSIDRIITLPVSRPTTCAFGGPDLQTLFVTSARSHERLSGSLFSLRADVPGDPIGRFQHIGNTKSA